MPKGYFFSWSDNMNNIKVYYSIIGEFGHIIEGIINDVIRVDKEFHYSTYLVAIGGIDPLFTLRIELSSFANYLAEYKIKYDILQDMIILNFKNIEVIIIPFYSIDGKQKTMTMNIMSYNSDDRRYVIIPLGGFNNEGSSNDQLSKEGC